MSIAWVFPGQGSQKLGMADGLLCLPGAKERFDFASELLGRDLLEICRAGNNVGDLNDTRNTQPALFIVESLFALPESSHDENVDLQRYYYVRYLNTTDFYPKPLFDINKIVRLYSQLSPNSINDLSTVDTQEVINYFIAGYTFKIFYFNKCFSIFHMLTYV